MLIHPLSRKQPMFPNVSVKQLSKSPCQRVRETSGPSCKGMIKMGFLTAPGGLGAVSPCVSLFGREFRGAQSVASALSPPIVLARNPG